LDTKLRNIKYSTGLKVFAAVMLWLCFMSAVGSAWFLLHNEDVVTAKSYYETNKFSEEFSRLVHNVVEYNIKLKSEERIKASGESESDIENNLSRFRRIEKRLSKIVNFAYYIKNSQTGETITNITAEDAVALLKSQPSYAYFSKDETYYKYYLFLAGDVMEMLQDTSYEVHAAVLEPLKEGDVFYSDFVAYSKLKTISTYVIILLIASIIIMITAFIYLILVAGRKEKGGEVVLCFPDRVYTDVHTLLVFILAVISFFAALSVYHTGFVSMVVSISIILTIDVFVGLSYVLSMVRQYKKRQILKNSLLAKIFNVFKYIVVSGLSGKMFKAWILLLLLGYGLINGIFFSIAILSLSDDEITGFAISVVLLLAFNIGCVYFAAKSLVSLTRIMGAVKEISAGNLDYALENKEISLAFLDFAKDIQSIQGGLKKAVAEAIKSERMKTDLITNVSHDLKTPLTSIVNYVDLLKKEELNNKKAAEYVNVLEEKSERLKQLIEDLIEASKASSGNIVINAEKVDLHELVMQACGEYEEKARKAALDFRINASDKEVSVLADGKHMWRIVENLLSNALKYSMPNSRVYINVTKNDRYGVLTIKNISALPLDIPPEQLMERFVRGDESRTTEGSGLGLSIVQSLTNVQGGKFKIEIDGDLFKAVVEMPLWQETGDKA